MQSTCREAVSEEKQNSLIEVGKQEVKCWKVSTSLKEN